MLYLLLLDICGKSPVERYHLWWKCKLFQAFRDGLCDQFDECNPQPGTKQFKLLASVFIAGHSLELFLFIWYKHDRLHLTSPRRPGGSVARNFEQKVAKFYKTPYIKALLKTHHIYIKALSKGKNIYFEAEIEPKPVSCQIFKSSQKSSPKDQVAQRKFWSRICVKSSQIRQIW